MAIIRMAEMSLGLSALVYRSLNQEAFLLHFLDNPCQTNFLAGSNPTFEIISQCQTDTYELKERSSLTRREIRSYFVVQDWEDG